MNPWLERRLGARLRAVANFVEGPTVADIGSDHGYLPAYLLQSGRAERMIIVDKHAAPLERARQALERTLKGRCEFRLGDGLEAIYEGELDCLSMCGFGALQMARILSAHPQRVPALVVLQSQDDPQPLREWGPQAGFALQAELAVGPYWVLVWRDRRFRGNFSGGV